MRRSIIISLVCAAALVAGCRRGPPPPSPEYEEANRLYGRLYVGQLDDAFGDPKMDEVVTLLRKVKKDTADHDAALALLARIEQGRRDFAKQREDDEKRRAALRATSASSSSIDAQAAVAAALPPREEPKPEAPDAGPATADPFAAGADIGALNRELGGCLLSSSDTFTDQASGKAGQVYRISDSKFCQGKAPGLQAQALLVVEGRLLKRVPEKELIVKKIEKTPPTVTPQQPAAVPAKAAEPVQVQTGAYMHIPGAPVQPGSVPAPVPPPSAGENTEYTGPKPEQPQPSSY